VPAWACCRLPERRQQGVRGPQPASACCRAGRGMHMGGSRGAAGVSRAAAAARGAP
jgi:hypothetical protein